MVSIASAGEINLDGKYIAINGDDIWHEYQRHTDEAVETGRNQVPFTVETMTDAIMAIYEPDVVESLFAINRAPNQRQSFVYAKKPPMATTLL